jgi:hypothetical protein
VTHHINGENGGEALIVEWQATAGIRLGKTRSNVELSLLGESGRCGDALRKQIDPYDACPRGLRQPKGRTAGPAAYVEQA